MTTCKVCKRDYDETDSAQVAHHKEPVNCGGPGNRCTRCEGAPACYTCGSSFCFCLGGH
ncbi:hypothetical protein [Streptomyces microflavus]|uniref:hypothetical protein n=1 Tax=Streptomyces microflavus TaxID=1919 RepID=UPI0032565953